MTTLKDARAQAEADALALLNQPIDDAVAAEFEVVPDDEPRPKTTVHSCRLSYDWAEKLFAESERRGVTPAEVIRDLVETGLAAIDADQTTVRLSDVRRMLDALARQAA